MKLKYISELAYPETCEILTAAGYTLRRVQGGGTVADPASPLAGRAAADFAAPASNHVEAEVSAPVTDHADLYFCRLGISDDAPVIRAQPGDLSPGYPHEASFNAVSTGRFFLHNLKATNGRLLSAARNLGMELLPVKQGYTRCSTIPVDENSIITYDRGIARVAGTAGLAVLLIEPGHVLLPGYNTGFLGGTCGNLDGRLLLFNGDLSEHLDFPRIVEFAEVRGLTCRWISGKPLRDIGSIV